MMIDEKPTFFLCDRKACNSCSYPTCKHTSDIEHAVNFSKGECGDKWYEKERKPFAIISFDKEKLKEIAKEYVEDHCGWISVKDRLPEEGVEVLALIVFGGYKHRHRERHLARREADKNSLLDYEHRFEWWVPILNDWCANASVTHWMPLPEPPEDEVRG